MWIINIDESLVIRAFYQQVKEHDEAVNVIVILVELIPAHDGGDQETRPGASGSQARNGCRTADQVERYALLRLAPSIHLVRLVVRNAASSIQNYMSLPCYLSMSHSLLWCG